MSQNESERFSRSLLESTGDGIWSIGTDGLIRYVNPAAVRLFGFESAEQMIGRNSHQLVHHSHADGASYPQRQCPIYKAFLEGRAVHLADEALWRRDGTFFHADYTSTPINDRGEITGAIVVFRDNTERLQMMDALLRSQQELTRSNEELERFAQIVSHDLKEPIRAVAGFVRLLADRYRGKFDPDADEFLDFALDGAKRMGATVDALLNLSRVSQQPAKLRSFESGTILENVLLSLKPLITETGARVSTGPMPEVFTDSVLLSQVLQNLVVNAIKYSRIGVLPEVNISCDARPDDWLFSVEDNGVGIEMAYSQEVFEPFRRLHGPERSGLGLGLATCKRIIEVLGGKIWVDSKVGRGSTFRFSIPRPSVSTLL
jgi:PAS domain S-box-containing protein